MNAIILDKPEQIEKARLITLKHALKLEVLGMKRRGRSVYSIVKSEFGFRGSKQRVFDQLVQMIDES
tara:strand:- start:594 stop:794 length:201 start_codon:yes stop_codon:yes gene_type:complete